MKYNQTVIIRKINAYLKSKKRKLFLDQGYCHGLTVLWLYKMSEHKEKWYYDLIKKIVNMPLDQIEDIEIDIEKFIAHIEWLQQPEKYVSTIRQLDMDKTVEIPKEIPVSSIFEPEQLDAVLDLVIQAEKMVCISGPDHSIGVVKRGELFHIYNPNYDSGEARIVNTIEALRLELIKCLFTDFEHSDTKLPVTINVLGDDNKEGIVNIYQWIIQSTGVMNFCDAGIGPLYLACENNNEKLAEMLLEKKATPNKPTNKGKYPLVLASYSGYANLVTLLLRYGADPNLEGREGLPLYLASKHGHENVIRILLHNGALINKADRDGDTAIFASVQKSQAKFTKLLLEHKADPLLPRKDGDTAMDIAIRRKDWDTVAVMLMYVDVPHARNLPILKRNKGLLLASAIKMREDKFIEPADSKKIVNLIEEIATKKRKIIRTIKNPEQSKREDESCHVEVDLHEDRNRFFGHPTSASAAATSVPDPFATEPQLFK